MHPFKQLLRQPLRTAAALIILTASAAFMCLSWGVYRSGLATAKAVDDGFTTLMVYDEEYLSNNITTADAPFTGPQPRFEKYSGSRLLVCCVRNFLH